MTVLYVTWAAPAQAASPQPAEPPTFVPGSACKFLERDGRPDEVTVPPTGQPHCFYTVADEAGDSVNGS